MKKRILAVLCAALLVLVGCGKPAPQEEQSPTPPPVSNEKPMESVPPEEPIQTRAAILYLPDANAEKLISVEVEVPQADLSAELDALIALLTEKSALPAGSAMCSVELADSLQLDMNTAFGEGMMSTGTTGELLYLGALVNTVLEYTGATTVLLTVDGEPLETGHTIYDEPLDIVVL